MSADPYADLCTDPAYSGTRFCQLRQPGEDPEAFAARDAAGLVDDTNQAPLAVTVTRGVRDYGWAVLLGALGLAWLARRG